VAAILATPARLSWTLLNRFVLAMAIIVMNVADVVTTRMLLDNGAREGNPIANHLIEQGALTEVKIGVAGLVAVLMLFAPLRRRAETFLAFACVAYGTVLAWHLVELQIVSR
jgi:hypothetical protein